MANLVISRETIEGSDAIPAGIYKLRLDGFKPSLSKKGDSINLNPILKTVGYAKPDGSEARIWFNMNTSFPPGLSDPCESAGFPLVQDAETGNYSIPGKFNGPDNDPTQWVYEGPLLGAVITAEITQAPSINDASKMRNEIKQFLASEGVVTSHKFNSDLNKKK